MAVEFRVARPEAPAGELVGHLEEDAGRRFLCGPSFETPAVGGLLRMRSDFAAKSQILMVRSPPKAGVSNHEAEHISQLPLDSPAVSW